MYNQMSKIILESNRGGEKLKKVILVMVSLILLVTIVAGCGGKEQTTAKEIMLEGIEKTQDIKSATIEGTMKIDFDMSQMNSTSEELMVLQMIPGIEVNYDGKQTVDPLQFEANIAASALFNGMNLSIEMPMMMKDNMMYIKLPGMIMPYMPDPSKEYILMDLSEAFVDYDQKKATEDSLKMMKTILDSLDETAFVKEDIKSFEIDGKVANAVSINITQENIKPFLDSFIKEGLPVIMEQMQNYYVTDEQKNQVEDFKAELDQNKEEIDKFVNELDKYITINTFKITSVYDKDGFERKAIMEADLVIDTETDGSLGLKISFEQNTNSINEEINFEMPIPSKDQTIDIEELEQMGSTF